MRIIAFYLIFFCSTSSLAKPTPNNDIGDKKQIKNYSLGVIAGSIYQVSLGTVALPTDRKYYVLGTGFEFGQNPIEHKVSFAFSAASGHVSPPSSWSPDFDLLPGSRVDASVILLTMKYALLDNIFINSAIGRRTVEASYMIRSRTRTDAQVEGNTYVESFIALFSVGNVFAFANGVFISCDWVDFSVPLYSKFQKKYFYLNSNSSARATAKDELTYNTSGPVGNIGTLKLGYIF